MCEGWHFTQYMENTWLHHSLREEGPTKLFYPLHFLLMVRYQARKISVIHLCVRVIDLVSFYDSFYTILDLFRQCRIFLYDFGLVQTVWYFSIQFWTCSDSEVLFYTILDLFWQCAIFLYYFWPVLTVSVRTGPKLYRKIPHCRNRSKIV
jgi:hypothetical protein